MTHAGSPLVTGYLDSSSHQGHHGEAMVHALAAASGLNVASYELDVGIDYVISTPGPRGTSRSPKIEVQIKSWSTPTGSATHWNYPLKVPAFNHLAGPGHDLRHYLVLCTVPNDAANYSAASVVALELRHAAYWLSLEGEMPDDTLNPLSTKTVAVPRSHLLTAETLVALVEGREADAVVP